MYSGLSKNNEADLKLELKLKTEEGKILEGELHINFCFDRQDEEALGCEKDALVYFLYNDEKNESKCLNIFRRSDLTIEGETEEVKLSLADRNFTMTNKKYKLNLNYVIDPKLDKTTLEQ